MIHPKAVSNNGLLQLSGETTNAQHYFDKAQKVYIVYKYWPS